MFIYKVLSSRAATNGVMTICLLLGLLVSGAAVADNATDKVIDKTDVPANGVLGRALSAAEVDALDRHIFADGAQLPDGQGSVEAGKEMYQQQCASCHGGRGEGGRALELVGDRALLVTEFPDKGIGVYWPYAPTLFEYIQRAMPPENPGLLTNDELYSLIGYLLYLNNLLPDYGTLNRYTLAAIELPNRDGFVDQYTFSNELEIEPVK